MYQLKDSSATSLSLNVFLCNPNRTGTAAGITCKSFQSIGCDEEVWLSAIISSTCSQGGKDFVLAKLANWLQK